MRKLLWIALLDGGGVAAGRDCRGLRGTVVHARQSRVGSVAEICHFQTFEACRDERSLWGTTAFCSQNPRYLPYWQARGFGQEPGRALSHKKKHRH